jgi:hypothetical protein
MSNQTPLPSQSPTVSEYTYEEFLYHGKEEWTAELNFQDLFEIPVEMKRFIPGFEYRFCNFQHYHDEPGLMKIAIYFSEKLILFLFRLYNKE